jgi:hypothetical protein
MNNLIERLRDWTVDNDATSNRLLDEAAARIEALEAALREIARQKLTHEHIDDFGEEEDHAGDYEGAYDIIVQIARAALALEQDK